MTPNEYSFTRYLAAKKSVDDRALNRHVFESLVQALSSSTPEGPLRLLEVGAGIGTMIERLLAWGGLAQAEYTAIDVEAANITHARGRLTTWAYENGFEVSIVGERLRVQAAGQEVDILLQNNDLFNFIRRARDQETWDVVIAHAFLDLIDVPATLPDLFSLIRPGGLFYFTLNFDGATIFEPPVDPPLEDLIQSLYHQTMDERLTAGKPSGDSRTGRRLFVQLRAAGAHLLAAGSSDWVVFPGENGYFDDEAYFLHFIIETIGRALQGHPDLERQRFNRWITRRHEQVEQAELIYLAHQLDFAGFLGEAGDKLKP
ncbi:MAG TPA: class I SAM-dependent methyltransferase [Anaerolineales bacterium]|nr:class I SAM-dependent methyltransferase [Anaerolineales bacterium]